MSDQNRPTEFATRWRFDELEGLELMRARYVTHSFAKHLHETFVVGVIESGVEGFYCEGKAYTAPGGSIILVNPGEVHTGYSAASEPWLYRSFYPSSELMIDASPHRVSSARQPFFSSRVIQDRQVAAMLIRAHRTLTRKRDFLGGHSQLLQALEWLVDRHAEQPEQTSNVHAENNKMRRVRDYLIDNSAENVSLHTLSKITGLSPSYLVRAFKKSFGIPPHKFLMNVRIERAKAGLIQNLPIAHVAYETGFADQSHLTRAFKRIVGVTPARYVL
jgi:AraC-like DNA-binding protein